MEAVEEELGGQGRVGRLQLAVGLAGLDQLGQQGPDAGEGVLLGEAAWWNSTWCSSWLARAKS